MHLPPAAAWTAGAMGRWRRVVATLGLLGLLVLTGFGNSQGWGASTAWLSLTLVVCTAVSYLGLRRPATGQLRWDGEQWHWFGLAEHAVTQIGCAIDLQRLMLLWIRCDQGTVLWLWLENGTMDAQWLAFRRAVVASKTAPRPSAESDSLR
jgi:hypothetical protein